MSRLPTVADRRGLRWLLNGRVMPGGPIVLLTHRGRRTGKAYTTPVEALVEDRERGEIVITPMRGERADWYRNILAGGVVNIRLRGESFQAQWRKLSEEESREALARYTHEHPLMGRVVLLGMARVHHVSGDPLAAVAKAAPLLAFRTVSGGGPAQNRAYESIRSRS
ncbi:MAG: nitroreductase family deazaflavin-dependent oxidoreductase [Candidatus Binatia bacterium]